MQTKYKRVILKLSGEALGGENGFGLDHDVINGIADQIIELRKLNVDVGVVVGGGNFWRGRQGATVNMNATTADHMGMLGTAINALAMQDALERKGQDTRVMTAVEMRTFAEPYICRRATRHLEKGRVIIFACGTGNPFFTTDTGAALRAAEIGADAVLMAKNIDGLYDDDPNKNKNASKIESISFDEVLAKNLKLVDNTAVALCKNNNIPIIVFALGGKGEITRAISGEVSGTIICG